MAVVKTKRGYQVQWYDVDGRFRIVDMKPAS